MSIEMRSLQKAIEDCSSNTSVSINPASFSSTTFGLHKMICQDCFINRDKNNSYQCNNLACTFYQEPSNISKECFTDELNERMENLFRDSPKFRMPLQPQLLNNPSGNDHLPINTWNSYNVSLLDWACYHTNAPSGWTCPTKQNLPNTIHNTTRVISPNSISEDEESTEGPFTNLGGSVKNEMLSSNYLPFDKMAHHLHNLRNDNRAENNVWFENSNSSTNCSINNSSLMHHGADKPTSFLMSANREHSNFSLPSFNITNSTSNSDLDDSSLSSSSDDLLTSQTLYVNKNNNINTKNKFNSGYKISIGQQNNIATPDEKFIQNNPFIKSSCSSNAALAGGENYSRKVFVGGLPPDIDEDEIRGSFCKFGNLTVDWPHKAQSRSYFPPKGYAFLLFKHEFSVHLLMTACLQEESKLFYFVSSPTHKNKQVQVRPWSVCDSDYVMDKNQPIDPRKTIFVGGVPRPLKAVELAHVMEEKFGSVCYAGIDVDPDLKYPKGAGRVAFSSMRSYISAVSARFVQLKLSDIDKKVEVKPYVMDDQMCDECSGINCGGKTAPFFCANVNCLRYFCEHCWAIIHSHPTKQTHRPLVKEGTDRLKSRWSPGL